LKKVDVIIIKKSIKISCCYLPLKCVKKYTLINRNRINFVCTYISACLWYGLVGFGYFLRIICMYLQKKNFLQSNVNFIRQCFYQSKLNPIKRQFVTSEVIHILNIRQVNSISFFSLFTSNLFRVRLPYLLLIRRYNNFP
jgi:hypothetical protein